MLDPRIFRGAFIPCALAAIVFLFSLTPQPGGLASTLAPDAFSAQNAATVESTLVAGYPDRRPGSVGDAALASQIAGQLSGVTHATVSSDAFDARTALGRRRLVNVTATLPGLSSRRVVIVADRSSLGSRADRPDPASLSGTAVMLELARVLARRTLARTVVLASVSGGPGGAGERRLLSELGGPVDAALALGDLAAVRLALPAVVPWGGAATLAPPVLRNTVAGALGAAAGLRPGGTGLLGQFARLALPFTPTAQGPLIDAGIPAVTLSMTGEHAADPAAEVSITGTASRIAAVGRAALQVVTALEQGPDLPAPSAYLVYDRKVIPLWAVRLLTLSLLLPAFAAAVDGFARARRRGCRTGRWAVWTLAAAVPFALAIALLRLAVAVGALAAPAGATGDGDVALRTGGVAALLAAALAAAVALRWLWPLLAQAAGRREPADEGGAGVGVLAVMCGGSLALWFVDPFAVVLVAPALWLWMWVTEPETRLRLPGTAALTALGLVLPLAAAVVAGSTVGLGPVAFARTAVLDVAGGGVPVLTLACWCVWLGCLAATVRVGLTLARRERTDERMPVTVRGPITYAGPGSLGGTDSALARRRS